MIELAVQQPGFLGVESARESVRITVSYWSDLASTAAWKQETERVAVQKQGRTVWYEAYIAKVERDYD